jgi:hypothetical protein
MNTETAFEKKLRKALVPVLPRKEYVAVDKRRFAFSTNMPVEMEHPRRMEETVTLAALGLGAIASIAAIATIGARMVGWISSGELIAKTSKTRSAKGVTP